MLGVRPVIGRKRGLRWLAAGAGVLVAGATVLAMSPAQADTATVDAQLSLSGVASKANLLGGTTIGVHPGDTVDFSASALPTAGLANIPALGPTLVNTLKALLGQYQVVVTFGSSFPGVGGQSVTLGGPATGVCKGKQDVPVTFPSAGTYAFTWKVQYVLPVLLSCTKNGLGDTALNQLKGAGIALNATNQWTGQIVAAANPPKGGLSVQLPGLGAAPSLPVLGQLPTMTLPALSLPTIPLSLPDLPVGSLPGLGSSSGSTGAGTGTGTLKPEGPSIPDLVVPKGDGNGPGTVDLGGGFGNVLPDLGNVGSGFGNIAAPVQGASTASIPSDVAPAASQVKAHTVELASSPSPSGQMPVLLAIIAVIALSLVTATYARLYLLRKA
jgi:hypothetical protein